MSTFCDAQMAPARPLAPEAEAEWEKSVRGERFVRVKRGKVQNSVMNILMNVYICKQIPTSQTLQTSCDFLLGHN